MAVTHLHDGLDPLNFLAEQIAEVVKDSLPVLTLQAARTMCNEAGLRRYQQEQESLLEQYAKAQESKRSARHRLDVARENLGSIVAEAEWTLGSQLVVRSNKTWIAYDEGGGAIPEDAQRSLTADEKKDWLTRTALKHPDAVAALAAVRTAEGDLEEANDQISLIDRSLSAVKHALDAARVDLSTLAMSITARKDNAA